MNKPQHCIEELFNPSKPSADRSLLRELTAGKAVEITDILQTSLDPSRQHHQLSMDAGTRIAHPGGRHRTDTLALDLELGRQARHGRT